MSECDVEGCARSGFIRRGWCQMHYSRWYKHGDPGEAESRQAPRGECSVGDCARVSTSGGRCNMHYHRWERYGEAGEAEPRKGPRGECSVPGCSRTTCAKKLCSRHYHRSRAYGLSADQLAAVEGVKACAICGREDPRVGVGVGLHIDHDHATGRVRGILCVECNKTLGQMNDDPERLRRAATYLEAGSPPWLTV